MDIYPQLQPIQTEQQLRALIDAAGADNHSLLYPSHLVSKNDELLGAFSLFNSPLLNVWLHSKKISPRESLMLYATVENVARVQGVKSILLPCTDQSPLSKYLAALGYSPICKTTLHQKILS